MVLAATSEFVQSGRLPCLLVYRFLVSRFPIYQFTASQFVISPHPLISASPCSNSSFARSSGTLHLEIPFQQLRRRQRLTETAPRRWRSIARRPLAR